MLAYTTMLWMVPLSLIVGERVGWRAARRCCWALVGIVVLVDPWRFDWNQKSILMGHGWLLLAALPGHSPSSMLVIIAGA